MVLCTTEGSEIVDCSNIVQKVLGTGLAQIAEIVTGQTAIDIFIIACNFTALDTGYDVKAIPAAGGGNKSFLRGSKTALAKRLLGGHSEFWKLELRAKENWVIQGGAETADSIAVTLSTCELVNSLAPETCA